MTRPLAGIFVGGASRRMGGRPKGLLAARSGSETLVARLTRVCREALGDPRLLLVGRAQAYAELGLPSLDDDPPDVGPIGGLRALLLEARASNAQFVIALSCDLPDVTPALIRKLVEHAPEAEAVLPRAADLWQPLFARYEPAATLKAVDRALAAGRRALQAVLDELDEGCAVLPLDAAELELLRDWDEPADLRR